MVEVFKTNVSEMTVADEISALLQHHFPECRVNFDLDDCDRVLRIAGKNVHAAKVMMLVTGRGFACSVME
jgi:hypothetical protein